MSAEKLYTVKEVSEMLGVSPLTLGRWLRNKELIGTKIGKQWRVTDSDLQAFIDKNRQV
ncbi:MAG: helix-turn-helix domain-containing protein [Bacteroidales bacterium]|nr:helix-turn-helix domain-containing protein [Bacteroidales bacterium]